MPRLAVELTVKHVAGVADPLRQGTAWYLLVELTSPNPQQNLAALLTDALQEAAARAIVKDALIATSAGAIAGDVEAARIGARSAAAPRREPQARRLGAGFAHPDLIEQGSELVRRLAPEGDVVGYGHMGDGNLHFNVSQRPDAPRSGVSWRAANRSNRAMFDLVESLGGSISAEHGIGRLKAAEFAARADPVELAVMRDAQAGARPERHPESGQSAGMRRRR